jgi:hypothetical protein
MGLAALVALISWLPRQSFLVIQRLKRGAQLELVFGIT